LLMLLYVSVSTRLFFMQRRVVAAAGDVRVGVGRGGVGCGC
jgi:hypothetical protein